MSFVKDKKCFKNPENSRYIDPFITNRTGIFQKTIALSIGLLTVYKTSFQKSRPKEILYRNYKRFDINMFKNILGMKFQSIKSYESFEQVNSLWS